MHTYPIRVRSLIFFVVIAIACALCKTTWGSPSVHYVLEGVKGAMRANIEARLTEFFKSKALTAPTVEEIKVHVRKAMQPYGYYKPQVVLNTQGRTIRIQISKGPPLLVTQIHLQVKGEGAPDFQKVISDFPLKQGDVVNVKKYLRGKQSFFKRARALGYLDASMRKSTIMISLKHYTAKIVISFDTGPQYFFGPVSFSKTSFDEAFLKRYVHFQEHAPFDMEQIYALQDDLRQSGYFSFVQIEPIDRKKTKKVLPLHMDLTPTPPMAYTLGLGYGTDQGIRGTLGLDLAHLTPTGDQFNALVQASQVQNSLQAQYLIPGKDPTTSHYSLTTSVYTLDYPSSESNAVQMGAAYLRNQGYWQNSTGVTALFEHYTTDTVTKEDSFMLYPNMTWKETHSDNPIFAKNGHSSSVTLQGGAQALLSSTDFAQIATNAKWIKTLKTHTRLYVRGDLGYTAVHNINDLPPSLQFYTGGSQTVRGYTYQSLGPGSNLMVGSVEAEQEVVHNGYVTAFYDLGNAFDLPPIELKRSFGGGILWVTLLGPIRLSLARPVDRDDRHWHIVLSMGPDL